MNADRILHFHIGVHRSGIGGYTRKHTTMSEPTVSWIGNAPAALASKLKDPQALSAFKTQLMTKITLVALSKSLPQTPVRTGTLRRSETTRVERGGDRGFLGSNLVYAPFVHKRVPFFQLGIDDAIGAAPRLMEQAGQEYLEGLTK